MQHRTSGLAAVLVMLCVGSATASADKAPESSGGAITLDTVVQLVIDKSPVLRSYALKTEGADAIRQYAGQFKNPRISISLEDFLGTGPLSGFSGTETTLGLSQTFQLGGKRGARSAVAEASFDAARAQYEERRIGILAETVVRFLHVAADQQRLNIATDATKLAAEGLAFASRRVDSGGASPVEKRRAEIALARSKVVTEHAEHELRASRRRLSMMWGDTEAQFQAVAANLSIPKSIPTYEKLAGQIDANPSLIHLAKERAIQRAQLEVEESKAVPDLNVNLGVRRAEGPDAYALVFGLAAPLPIFDRNQGAVGAASAKQHELEAQQEDERVRLLSRLYGDIQELTHAKTELESLDREIIPNAKAVLELSNAGFKSGRFSQLELLDAQKTLIELQGERVAAALELWTLVIRVNSLVGANAWVQSKQESRPPSQGDGNG